MVSIEETLASLEWKAAQPSVDSLLSILQMCRQHKNLVHAKYIHKYIHDNGLETHQAIGNHLVPMFVECGSMLDARQVFDRLAQRNEYSWTCLIQGYIHRGDLQHAFKLYQKMQDDCVHPSKFTFVALLKASAQMKCMDRGREMHAEVAKEEFENDLFIGNSLVDFYAKCGSLVEAQEVFDTLPVQNVVSWNTLIGAYAEHGLCEEALNCFDMMKQKDILQDAVTFLCSLKACGSIETIDKCREIHAEIIKEGFEEVHFVGNSLVDVYAKCGLVAEAQGLFDELRVRDVVSWNALIAGYAEHGFCEEVLNCFEHMQKEDVSLDAVTFLCSLKACGSTGAIERGREIHAEAVKEGLEGDVFVGNTLMDMYAKCGSLADAKEVFDQLPVQDVVSWNVLFTGYAECGLVNEALICFKQMQTEGVSPNATIFLCILKACGSVGALDKGQEVHADIVKKGLERDLFISNSVVDMYAKCGSLEEALAVFNRLPSQDVVSWNTLIAGYAEHGLGEEALNCLKQMRSMGVCPDAATFICSLKSCGTLKAINRGQELHVEIIEEELEGEFFVGNTLVDLYAKCGWHLEAQDVFDQLPVRNVVSWTVLMSGYAEHGLGEEVLNCLERMQLEGVYPDAVTLVCSLKGCGSIGALERGREIHAVITRAAFDLVCSNLVSVYAESRTNSEISGTKATKLNLANALIDMYGKCGSMIDAQKVFNTVPIVDAAAWNALIAGYARQEESELVFHLVHNMREDSVQPDEITFLSVLSVCSHTGLLDEGQKYLKAMYKEYGITLTIGHYNCLLDLFGRAGQLDEAVAIVEVLPFEPNLVTWSTLLDACRKGNNVKLSRKAFECAVRSAEEETSAFILMSNIYAGCLDMEGFEGE